MTEQWVLFTYTGTNQYVRVSKGFKTREEAEEERLKYPKRERGSIGIGRLRMTERFLPAAGGLRGTYARQNVASLVWRIKGEGDKLGGVDERRKIALLLAASILAARRIATAPRNSPAYVCAIADAIRDAQQILARIDREWPEKTENRK